MNNEPAFPHEDTCSAAFRPGLTIRDYFAAKAMQGLMGRVWGERPAGELFAIWASSSYKLADAMIEARGES